MTEPQRSEFDSYAGNYQAEVEKSIAFAGVRHDVFLEAKADALAQLARRRGRDLRALSVLDLGCGVGVMTRMLGRSFGRVHGTDVSREAVRTAARQGAQPSYSLYDGARLPFQDGAFDFAVTACVLHHVLRADRPALMRELLRVTRPPGGVVVFEHNPWNPLTRLAVSRCEFDRDAELLTPSGTRALMEHAGATVEESRYILFLPWRHPIVDRIENALHTVPLGAQYLVFARAPS